MPGRKIFMEITNQDIYEKLCHIESHVKRTNGKVRLNKWIATTALSLVVMSIPLILICSSGLSNTYL